MLSGVPSIAIGLFAYAVLVAPFKHFSAFSASFAFMMLMLPLLVRTSEQAIRSVPQTVREGALALGMSNFRATVRIVIPTAMPAIITALLLAIARVTGETAPLLFTAFGSQFWETNPSNPMAELSLQVFTYAISPYPSWQAQAWGGAFLLIVAVFVLSLGCAADVAPGDAGTGSVSATAVAGELLAADDLSAYYGERKAVGNVSMAFRRKAVTALIGPSGCGKTTLLRCFNRIHELSFDARVEGSVLARGPGHHTVAGRSDGDSAAHRHGFSAS